MHIEFPIIVSFSGTTGITFTSISGVFICHVKYSVNQTRCRSSSPVGCYPRTLILTPLTPSNSSVSIRRNPLPPFQPKHQTHPMLMKCSLILHVRLELQHATFLDEIVEHGGISVSHQALHEHGENLMLLWVERRSRFTLNRNG